MKPWAQKLDPAGAANMPPPAKELPPLPPAIAGLARPRGRAAERILTQEAQAMQPLPEKECGETARHEPHDWILGGFGSTDYRYCSGRVNSLEDTLIVRIFLDGATMPTWQEVGRAKNVLRDLIARLEGMPRCEGKAVGLHVLCDSKAVRVAAWGILATVYEVSPVVLEVNDGEPEAARHRPA